MQTDGGRSAALDELKERLRRLRVERRLSMAGLEQRAELGHTTASRALNGATVPSEATVVALARALRTDAVPLLELRRQALPPAPPEARALGDAGGGADAQFEVRYRRYVEQRHGQLSVIGLDLSRPERACWPLDAAYLSLELSTPAHSAALPNGPRGIGAGPDGGMEVRVERAEQALAGRRRTLVRGLAGSGKTTLLQWLALATARRNLPGELAHLDSCLPFVLPLRTLIRRGELPAPQEYLAAVGCPLHAAQPPGWADQVLADGLALLLIDGIDEVPQTQRTHTRQWLRELLAAYPQAAYLVTTRPSAVPEGWLADSDFTELTVRPMSTRDVAVFVTRWHTAAAAGTNDPQERAHLAALDEALKDTVRSQRDLARLTTTPLLCALVCALHRDRRGHLPRGRMELYEAALSMLLHRRDRERDIDAPEGLTLTEHQSIQLLQRLAYWLIRNGQTELDHDTAHTLIDDALPAMPHLASQADGAGVLGHLVARSGLLRTPTAETIDFVHRTFQDYLGAKACVEARDLPLLVRHAHDDQWEDVLRMAVAHARPHERATLLRRLIARGDRTPKHRTRLHLLATACLEHATEIDPVVRQEVQDRTTALLPPRSSEEARALVTVGPVILDLLPGPDGLEDDEAEAVVHTARLLGGDAALTVMKKFRASTQENIQGVLQNAWDRFDTHDYIREVLAHIPGLSDVTVTSTEQLAALHQLQTPQWTAFVGDFPSSAMTAALDPKKIRSLSFNHNSTLQNLDFLRPYTALRNLYLIRCPNITDLTYLAESPSIDRLQLSDCDAVRIEDLEAVTGLRALGLDMALPCQDLGALPVCAELTSLFLGSKTSGHLRTLQGITRWPHLTSLNLHGPINDFVQVAALPNLRELVLPVGPGLSMFEQFPPAPQIEELHLGTWTEGDDLALIRRTLPRLKRLSIRCYGGHRHVGLTPLRGMPDLTIHISGATEVLGTEHFPPEAITRSPRPRT
ncbi:NACHT domain-containing protein [Streptomyces prunicolor]|uniref:NACHT domain-containing protein n=1 Tax=Streptomyces prunicolor TaxID=67348 RepID=UPI00386DC05D|nr:NACHT domain-containing protein [Streptomyces prunicolor]WSV18295.1 NACHT domain-containing protein [Streptomyces prunicolor]